MKTRTRRSALPAALACFLCLAALAALLILGVSLLRPSSRNALTLTRPTALVLDDAWADSLNSLSDAAAVRQAVTDALEAYRQSQEDTFSWYLAQHLPKVQDARTVVEDGYVFFFIGEKADEAEQMFRDFVAAQV